MRMTQSLTVAVIGAGIVGLTAALEILRSGHRVIIIEPSEPGGRQAASYGNGTWLNPGAVMPISVPGLWRKVPGFLTDPAKSFSPFAGGICRDWRPGFCVSSSPVATGRASRPAPRGNSCCKDTVGAHAALAEEAGVPELVRRRGTDVRLSRPGGVSSGNSRMDAPPPLRRRLQDHRRTGVAYTRTASRS